MRYSTTSVICYISILNIIYWGPTISLSNAVLRARYSTVSLASASTSQGIRSWLTHSHNLSYTWCGRKVMRLATLCTNWQGRWLHLHMAVRLTTAVHSVQFWTCYSCYAIVDSVWSEVVFVRCVTKMDRQSLSKVVPSNFV